MNFRRRIALVIRGAMVWGGAELSFCIPQGQGLTEFLASGSALNVCRTQPLHRFI